MDALWNAFSSSRISQAHQLWCKQDPLKTEKEELKSKLLNKKQLTELRNNNVNLDIVTFRVFTHSSHKNQNCSI